MNPESKTLTVPMIRYRVLSEAFRKLMIDHQNWWYANCETQLYPNDGGNWYPTDDYNLIRRSVTGCYYCNDSGVNYKVDGAVVKCQRCFTSPLEFYVNSEDLSICLR